MRQLAKGEIMKLTIMLNCMLLLVLFVAPAPVALASNIWYVNGLTGNNSYNCMSAQTACKTIGHAISLPSSGDTIKVAAATYSELLTIPKSLSITIVGSGALMTIIDGRGRGPVVLVHANSRVIISGVTIRNGHGLNGAGISNFGVLTVSRSILVGNVAYGRCSGSGPCYGGAGGGVLNEGTMIISNSTITQNAAEQCIGIFQIRCYGQGGGIWNTGTLTINADTLSANFVDRGIGSGVFNDGGTVRVNNSTVSMNSGAPNVRGGALYNLVGSLTVNNSTVSNNNGGIFNQEDQSTEIFQNAIVANNGVNCKGHPITSRGYNLSSDDTCNFNNTGDLNNTDPKLGTLGNYGGPTQTIPPLSGSPAIDAGNPGGCTDGAGHLLKTDQRGLPRPDREDKTGCDMGAYETQSLK
jgi:hypothetical protein